MSESPPHSPPPSPPHRSEEPQLSDLPNPNPSPNCDPAEINPPEKSQPLALESENPPPKSTVDETQKIPDHEIHPIEQKACVLVDVDEEQEQEQQQQGQQQQVDDELEQEEEEEAEVEVEEEEGINMNLSPLPQSLASKNSKNAVSSVRRNKKSRKGFGKKAPGYAMKKKMQALSEGFKPIPFVPGKLSFSRHEENLRRLGLWDFVHVEFDRNVRVDLLVQLVGGYGPKSRVAYVADSRIKVSRADLARALKLPVKKPSGDCEEESFPGEFLSFLEEFVSNWMLLHECDVWVTPHEIVNWMKMIKEGHPQKVDWAGMVWFMMEKELAQGSGLKECYYASHLQQLIKDQKEHLLIESPKLVVENQKVDEKEYLLIESPKLIVKSQKVDEVNLEEEGRAGDTEMMDAEESSLGEEKSADQSVDFQSRQNCLTHPESSGAPDMAEQESYPDLVPKDGDANMVDMENDVVFDTNMVDGDYDITLAGKDGEASTMEKIDDINRAIDEADDGSRVCLNEADGIGYIDDIECIENENSAGMTKGDMVDYGDCNGIVQRPWCLDGRDDGGQHILQRCSLADLKMATEATPGSAGEDAQDDEGGANEQVEGFEIQQKDTLGGMSSRNFMQHFETGDLQYTSGDLGGQSSFGLLPSRPENDVRLDASLFNHGGKRGMDYDHDMSHHALDDDHKRMRIDGHWDHKAPDVETCLDQIKQLVEKARMGHETVKEEAYQQANMMQVYAHQVEEKEAEVMQWKCKFDELQRRKHAEVSRRDRELHLMSSVIEGYRRALKDTHRQFTEYRKRCQIPDEPIYRDAGPGGVVKSVMQLERERLKEEDEKRKMCHLLQDKFKEQINHYESQWEELHSKVLSLDNRLTDAAMVVQLLKDDFQERRMSKNVVMSEEVESVAREELDANAMSPEGRLTNAEEEVEPSKIDILKPDMSENVALSEEVRSEAQGSLN